MIGRRTNSRSCVSFSIALLLEIHQARLFSTKRLESVARASESQDLLRAKGNEECVAFEEEAAERIVYRVSALSREFSSWVARAFILLHWRSFTATEACILAARNDEGTNASGSFTQVAHDLQYFNPGRDRGKLGRVCPRRRRRNMASESVHGRV